MIVYIPGVSRICIQIQAQKAGSFLHSTIVGKKLETLRRGKFVVCLGEVSGAGDFLPKRSLLLYIIKVSVEL